MDHRQRTTGAALAARIALYGWTAIAIIEVVCALDFVAGGGTNVWFASGDVLALAAAAVLGATVLTAIVVAVWIYRAMTVAHELNPALDISPGWAVGWYFIPFASLWKPYEAMVEIVEASGARRPGKWAFVRDLVGWWWAAWIARSILGWVQFYMPHNPDSDVGIGVPQAVVILLSGALGIAAALCLAAIILNVAKLQLRAVDPSIFD